MEGLLAEGIVGLYRVGKKEAQEVAQDQRTYLSQSEFLPSPNSLRGLLGSLGPDHTR
jgi:hypothetical protein